MTERRWLEFSIKILKAMHMWPEKKYSRTNPFDLIKQNYIIIFVVLNTVGIAADFFSYFNEDKLSISEMNESLIALIALVGVIYIYVCYVVKRDEIKTLVDDLSVFKQFCPISLIVETEESVHFYTKSFVIYGIVGNVIYGLMPMLERDTCLVSRTPHMVTHGLPCGTVAYIIMPFRADRSPRAEFVAIELIVLCTLGTVIILTITMLVCGILMHIAAQLKHLKLLITGLSNTGERDNLRENTNCCIRYHILVIDYSNRAIECFSKMMLLHISLTGLIMSILVYELIIVETHLEAVRFIAHLLGWLAMLFLVCYYGQTLMDESAAIFTSLIHIDWYDMPVRVQKDLCMMFLRSQRPLLFKAAGMRTMSLETFLQVLYSAYSYFTLLVRMKT